MKVKELLKLLVEVDPESVVFIRDDGSILPTDNFDAHRDYNVEPGGAPEFFVLVSDEWLASEEWEDEEDER